MNLDETSLKRSIHLREHLRNTVDFMHRNGVPLALGSESALAGQPGDSLASWLSDTFNRNFDAYDRAIDAVYNQSHTGGPLYHHIIDGNHDIWNAFDAVGSVSADDGWLTEMAQASEHLMRDGMSVSGINPFLNMTPSQFNDVAAAASHLGVSRMYLADALTLNGPELIGGGLALISAVIIGRKSDPSRLTQLGSGCLISALVSANPLLLPIAAGTMIYGFHSSKNRPTAAISAGKGAFVSGAALLAANLVGGPFWLGCIAAAGAAVLINYSLEHPITTLRKITDLTRSARSVIQQASVRLSILSSEVS